MDRVTVALVDDHELVREGLVALLARSDAPVDPIAAVGTVRELRDGPGRGVDVVLLDLNLGDGSTVHDNVLAVISMGSRVVVVSQNETPSVVRQAVRAGALGYVPKSAGADEMLAGILEVHAGRTFMTAELALAFLAEAETTRPSLSARELETLRLYASGMPMKTVARRLAITEGAVKSYVDRVREKYENAGRRAPTKVDLYRRAIEDGHLMED